MSAQDPRQYPGSPLGERRWPAGVVPVVSVLCLAYNHERFIAACLNGILMQVTDFPVEILVHDDASTDGTPQIIQTYAQKYPGIILPVLQAENQFSLLRKIRPRLMQRVRGAFVACCDGDDVWLDPYKLAKQVAFLRENPAYVMSYHDAVRVDLDWSAGKTVDRHGKKSRPDFTQAELRELKWGCPLLGTTLHRNVPIDFPPEYDLVPNGDNFLPMLLAAHGGAKFQAEVEPLAYRQHGGGMWSARTSTEKVRMHLQSYLQIASYFVRIGEAGTARKIITGRLVRFIVEYFNLNYLRIAAHFALIGLSKAVIRLFKGNWRGTRGGSA